MKSSKAKMIAGEPYIPMGKELFEDRLKAQEQVFIFNNLAPSKLKARIQLLKGLFAQAGPKLYIESPFRCDYGYNIHLGDNFYANYNLTILDSAPVHIGKNVLIAPNVSLLTATHPIHPELRVAGWELAKSIHIGDNVWIGAHTVVNPGVSIGENSVIGSGSVVTKDIPANVVAVGNPCKVMRAITVADKKGFED